MNWRITKAARRALLATALTAASGVLGGAVLTGVFDTPASPAPAYPTPPGWTAHPHGAPTGQICFGVLCYPVDSQGRPYGAPASAS